MSSSKTPLGLNRWKLDENPRMVELHEDNQIIDEKLREALAGISSYTALRRMT